MEERIELYDGKYTVILTDNGKRFRALRYGEEWKDLAGDGMVLSMFYKIQELEEENKTMKNRLEISPQGDDKIDELEDIISKMARRIKNFEERYFE